MHSVNAVKKNIGKFFRIFFYNCSTNDFMKNNKVLVI